MFDKGMPYYIVCQHGLATTFPGESILEHNGSKTTLLATPFGGQIGASPSS